MPIITFHSNERFSFTIPAIFATISQKILTKEIIILNKEKSRFLSGKNTLLPAKSFKAEVFLITLLAFASITFAQSVVVKNSSAEILLEINDEGTDGSSITIPSGSEPSGTNNKLYNDGGTLKWDGSALGTAGSAGGWTDGGSNVYLTTTDDNVGIGTTNPYTKFEVEWIPPVSNVNPVAVFETSGKTSSAAALRVQNTSGNKFHFGMTAPTTNAFAIAYNTNIGLASDLLRITSDGNVGIGITSPTARLHVSGDEGLLVQGTNGNGTIQNLGRLHFYSKKSAFRAGYVSGSEWDDTNIGDYSVAMGCNTTASGWGGGQPLWVGIQQQAEIIQSR